MNDRLSTQLRTELQHFSPDLGRLARGSLASGRRRRHVRRAGIALVGIGAVAGVGVFGVLVTGSDVGPAVVRDDSLVAGAPDGPELRVGQVIDVGRGLNGTIVESTAGLEILGFSDFDGPGAGFVVLVDGPAPRLSSWWAHGFGLLGATYPDITVVITKAKKAAIDALNTPDEGPVIAPAGWTCEWYLVDDKAACASADGGVAGLVIRDAADRAAWVADPDKGDDPAVYTTEAHDGIFITVQGGQGTANAEIQELGAGLVWGD